MDMGLSPVKPKLAASKFFPTIFSPSSPPLHFRASASTRSKSNSLLKRIRVRSELDGKVNGVLSGDFDPRFVDRVHFGGYPANILTPCEGEDSLKWSIINSLK